MSVKYDNHDAVIARRDNERGAALATALIILALITVISASVLALVSSEAGIAGGDLQRTQTFYAAQGSIERMTNNFSALFISTTDPDATDLATIEANQPAELTARGFTFNQRIVPVGSPTPTSISEGAFRGLNATVTQYDVTSTARMTNTNTEVSLTRRMNNYLIPLFQFGIFSDEDVELHPGPAFYFNGRVHANGNLYVNGNVTFLSNVTSANEIVLNRLRNGATRTPDVKVRVGATLVPMTEGSVFNGPNLPPAQQIDGRGIFPGHPDGTVNNNFQNVSVENATGVPNRFGTQVLYRMTRVTPLRLPLQLAGAETRELIKRRITGETATNRVLSESRLHNRAHVRVLIDDEGVGTTDTSSIQNYYDNSADPLRGRGVLLSTFIPRLLGNAGGQNAMARINDAGTFIDAASYLQQTRTSGSETAATVRGTQSVNTSTTTGSYYVPAGAGLRGRILIEVVNSDNEAIDVTQEVMSMGVTVGEPNAIVHLQRPLWAAFMQGSRDRENNNLNLAYHLNPSNDSRALIDGELRDDTTITEIRDRLHRLIDRDDDFDSPSTSDRLCSGGSGSYWWWNCGLTGFMRAEDQDDDTDSDELIDDDGARSSDDPFMPSAPVRSSAPTGINQIVPINVYNVREGAPNVSLHNVADLYNNPTDGQVYTRGITSVVEINMRNLVRWLSGTYDSNLLSGTNAVSTNVNSLDNGYIVYVSDRRGDRLQGAATTRNGIVDNEDIYGTNGAGNGTDGADCSSSQDQNGCERGEDVSNNGLLSRDTQELPVPTALVGFPSGTTTNVTDFIQRSINVSTWNPASGSADYHFRRAVRLFNGETLAITGPVNSLHERRGVTVVSENMAYIWGNYNTTGISAQPAGGATLAAGYTGAQVPAAIMADAFFPLSKTWFDSSPALFPWGLNARPADAGASVTQETAVRAGIIAGINLSAQAGTPDAGNGPDSRLSGGIHNYPRFMENWLYDAGWNSANRRWNFIGSLIPLYRSTQAVGPWQYPQNNTFPIYGAPVRNWAFDTSFTDPARLPPGTPMFQYIVPTAFRQVL